MLGMSSGKMSQTFWESCERIYDQLSLLIYPFRSSHMVERAKIYDKKLGLSFPCFPDASDVLMRQKFIFVVQVAPVPFNSTSSLYTSVFSACYFAPLAHLMD